MVTAPYGVQNSAYRFTYPKIFSDSYATKDKDKTQALIKGSLKEKTREKAVSQQP
jgi:hypothetical protein